MILSFLSAIQICHMAATSFCTAHMAFFLFFFSFLLQVKAIKAGVSSISSVNNLYLSGEWAGTAAAIGTVVGLISLTGTPHSVVPVKYSFIYLDLTFTQCSLMYHERMS